MFAPQTEAGVRLDKCGDVGCGGVVGASEGDELGSGEHGTSRGVADLTCGRASRICHSYTQPSAAVKCSELQHHDPISKAEGKKSGDTYDVKVPDLDMRTSLVPTTSCGRSSGRTGHSMTPTWRRSPEGSMRVMVVVARLPLRGRA